LLNLLPKPKSSTGGVFNVDSSSGRIFKSMTSPVWEIIVGFLKRDPIKEISLIAKSPLSSVFYASFTIF